MSGCVLISSFLVSLETNSNHKDKILCYIPKSNPWHIKFAILFLSLGINMYLILTLLMPFNALISL